MLQGLLDAGAIGRLARLLLLLDEFLQLLFVDVVEIQSMLDYAVANNSVPLNEVLDVV